MQYKPVQNIDVTTSKNTSKPSSGSISTVPSSAQLQHLLSGDLMSPAQNSSDITTHKQQQLFTIHNILDRQETLLNDIDLLVNNNRGAHWLDAQISEFKSLCPAELLLQISHPSSSKLSAIEHCDIINQHFLSLVIELLHSPLISLSKTNLNEINELQRSEWYEWCNELTSQIETIKHKVRSAQTFFSIKTFDNISRLAKDKRIREQLGIIKHLFQHTHFLAHDVECND